MIVITDDFIKRRCPFCGAPVSEVGITLMRSCRRFKSVCVSCAVCGSQGPWTKGRGVLSQAAAVWDWNQIGTARSYYSKPDGRRDKFLSKFGKPKKEEKK